jgi:Endoribonuclease L-PSP
MKKAIQTPLAPAAIAPYSQAIEAGDTIFCSGQFGLDPGTGGLVAGGVGVSPRVIVNLSDECVALSKCDQPLSGLVRPHGLEAHLPGQNSACATSSFLDKGV